jgi:hypothetical protein
LDPAKAGIDEILDTQFFRVKIDRFQRIDHRWDQAFGQRKGGIMLWIAANLQDPLADLRECGREIRGCGAFSDTAFTVDGKNLGAANLQRRIECDLQTALPIAAGGAATGPAQLFDECLLRDDMVHAASPE